jgi:hypothetical protein
MMAFPTSTQRQKHRSRVLQLSEEVPQPRPLSLVSYSMETAVMVKKSGGTALLQGECMLKCLRTIRPGSAVSVRMLQNEARG